MKIEIKIHDEIAAELQYLVDLHHEHGAQNRQESVEGLLAYVAATLAEGGRRPGAWEREILGRLGLVADCDEIDEYRPTYGRPAPQPIDK